MRQHLWIDSVSAFPSYVLMISFFCSVAIILTVVIGETVNTSGIPADSWIRRFGVTPILAVIGALFSLWFTASSFSDKIFPPSAAPPAFFLTNVGVSCQTPSGFVSSPQATHLLAIISSADRSHIADVDNILHNPKIMGLFYNSDYKFVHHGKIIEDADMMKIIWKYRRFKETWTTSLFSDISAEEKWLAYDVAIGGSRSNHVYTYSDDI